MQISSHKKAAHCIKTPYFLDRLADSRHSKAIAALSGILIKAACKISAPSEHFLLVHLDTPCCNLRSSVLRCKIREVGEARKDGVPSGAKTERWGVDKSAKTRRATIFNIFRRRSQTRSMLSARPRVQSTIADRLLLYLADDRGQQSSKWRVGCHSIKASNLVRSRRLFRSLSQCSE